MRARIVVRNFGKRGFARLVQMQNIGMNAESVMETPLAAVHRAAGATISAWFGCELPDSWGDAREEQRFANESAALIDKNYRAYLNPISLS